MATTFDSRALHAAIARTASTTGRELKDVVRPAAKSFIPTIVSITPPGSGKKAGDAKKAGEGSVTKDYRRAFRPLDEKFVNYLYYISGRAFRGAGASRSHREMTDGDARWLNQILGYAEGGRTGALTKIFRDMKVKRKWLPTVTKAQVDSFRDVNTGKMRAGALFVVPAGAVAAALGEAVKQVGHAAAGWNASAKLLGAKLPAWVRRHSTKGSAVIFDQRERFTITLENACGYIGNLDYERRMAWAMNAVAGKLERQAAHALRAGLQKSGWH